MCASSTVFSSPSTRPSGVPTASSHAEARNRSKALVAAGEHAVLELDSMLLSADSGEARVEGSPHTGSWSVLDQQGAPVLVIAGMALR